jgi:hypothetical protein
VSSLRGAGCRNATVAEVTLVRAQNVSSGSTRYHRKPVWRASWRFLLAENEIGSRPDNPIPPRQAVECHHLHLTVRQSGQGSAEPAFVMPTSPRPPFDRHCSTSQGNWR